MTNIVTNVVTNMTTKTTKPKVLLIEDDQDISSVYVQLFELEGGLEVKVADNGLEGLKLFALMEPDIVLLDMMMPQMSGIETLKRLRSLPGGSQIKVIALTNMNDPDTVRELEELKVARHIVKANTTAKDIVDVVRTVL